MILCFKLRTAYEMRISDWSSDVCSSHLIAEPARAIARIERGDIALPEPDRAALDRDQRRHRLDQCRFARAVGAEDRGDAAGAEDRADIVEDRAGSEIGRAHV